MAKFRAPIQYSPSPPTVSLPAPESPQVPVPLSAKFFRILKECRIPQGASYYTLPVGKVISSCGYDIAELQRMGVPMEETTSRVSSRMVIVP